MRSVVTARGFTASCTQAPSCQAGRLAFLREIGRSPSIRNSTPRPHKPQRSQRVVDIDLAIGNFLHEFLAN